MSGKDLELGSAHPISYTTADWRSQVPENITDGISRLYFHDENNHTDNVNNYWPQFGPLQYFELTYIFLLITFGTFGNLVVIFSIALERKVHSSGNIFIINLAIADILICTVTLPSVAANILHRGNAINQLLCDIVGYIVTTTAACSICNLALVALNRYWAVVKYAWYRKHFTKKIGITMSILSWIWSILLVSPTVLGWASLTFDAKALVCAWDDAAALSYSIFLIIAAVGIPLGVIAFSYFRIFSTVRASGRWRRNLISTTQSGNNRQHRMLQRERSLIYTLLTTVIIFCVCWTPYAIHVLIDPGNTSKHLKKFLVWLALTNSSVNFIIYGTLNPAFKKGYKKLFCFVFRCYKDDATQISRWSSGHTADRTGNLHNGQHQSISNRNEVNSRYSAGREIPQNSCRNFDMVITESTEPAQVPQKVSFRVRLKQLFAVRVT